MSDARYILTVRDLDADEPEIDRVLAYVTTLVGDLGHHEAIVKAFRQQDLNAFGRGRLGQQCPECGARDTLHSLACSKHPQREEAAQPLTEAELQELRERVPYWWSDTWPPDEYDQGQPIVEIRQDHLRALLADAAKGGRGGEKAESQDG